MYKETLCQFISSSGKFAKDAISGLFIFKKYPLFESLSNNLKRFPD